MAQVPTIERTVVCGAPVITLPDHSVPLVRFVIASRRGAVHDPFHKAGRTNACMELLLRGTRSQKRRLYHSELEELGSSISVTANNELAFLSGVALQRHMSATWDKVCAAFLTPAFLPEEFAHLMEENINALILERDDDETVADHFLSAALYPHHPLGRSPAGSVDSLQALDLGAVVEVYKNLHPDDMVLAFAGALEPTASTAFASVLLQGLAQRAHGPTATVPAVPRATQRRIVVVDKPDRTQVQLRLGQVALAGNAKNVDSFWLGVMAFGGTFTSPLTREVRDIRGWSYVAHADFRRRARFAAPLVLRSAPALSDVVPCLELELQLLDDLSSGKLELPALELARQYILNRYPFEVATAFDMLGSVVSHELLGQPTSTIADFPNRLQALDLQSVAPTMAEVLSETATIAVLVAPAATIVPILERRFDASTLQIIDFRQGLGLKDQE